MGSPILTVGARPGKRTLPAVLHRVPMRLIGLAVALGLALVPIGAWAESDYTREKRWADEIIPGIVVGDALFLQQPAGHKFLSIYTKATNARAALVLVHGIGVHPDWGLIGRLRSALPDDGYTTLSVQMPVLAQAARVEEYYSTFAEAGERLKIAADFLRARGYTKAAIVSHSMGSRMTHDYLTRDANARVSAWVCIGWASEDNDFSRVSVPVLDLFGENDWASVLKGATKRAPSLKSSPGSQQIEAPATDHYFSNRHVELVKYVREFLDKVFR
jgi:alpha/beta superfamily hydrolase